MCYRLFGEWRKAWEMIEKIIKTVVLPLAKPQHSPYPPSPRLCESWSYEHSPKDKTWKFRDWEEAAQVCPGAAEWGGLFGHTLEKEREDRNLKKTLPVNVSSTVILEWWQLVKNTPNLKKTQANFSDNSAITDVTGHEWCVLKDGPHDPALILIIAALALLKAIFLIPYFVIIYHLALVWFSFL